MMRLAEAGDRVAQCELGVVFYYGYEAPQDDCAALRWLVMSAVQGLGRA